MRQSQRGFTLIEVIVAMAIAAIGLIALMDSAGVYSKNTARLRDKVTAQWVANNVMSEMLLLDPNPGKGKKEGEEQMAGQTWRWTRVVSDAAQPPLKRVEVKVYKGESPTFTLVTYVGDALQPTSSAQQSAVNGQSNNQVGGNNGGGS